MSVIKYTKKNRVEIGIVVCNEVDYIRSTIDSLLQNYDYIDRIIISDNCSDDGTTQICKEYANRYCKIDFYVHSDRMSLFAHMKWVIEQADCEFFMFVRVKDIFDEDYVRKCLYAFDNNKASVVAATNIIGFPENTNSSFYDRYNISRLDNMCSHDVIERINVVLRYHEETCRALWFMCRYEVLRECIEYINYKMGSSDHIVAMYMALQGPWVLVKDTNFKRFTRIESYEEKTNRWNRAGLSHVSNHRLWNLPLRFWELIKYYYKEELITVDFFNKFLLQCGITYDAYWTDDEWIKRHSSSGIETFLRDNINGRNIVLMGINYYSVHVSDVLCQRYKYKIQGYIDVNDENVGRFINGVKILPFKDIFSINHKKTVIIISSYENRWEMMDCLLESGLQHRKDFLIIPGEVYI